MFALISCIQYRSASFKKIPVKVIREKKWKDFVVVSHLFQHRTVCKSSRLSKFKQVTYIEIYSTD